MSKTRKSVLIICITLLIMLVPVWLCSSRIVKGTSFVNSDPDSLFYYRIVDQALQKGSEKYIDYDNYGNFPHIFKIGYPRFYYWLLYSFKFICTNLSSKNSEFLFGLLPVITTTLTALIIIISLTFLKYPPLFIVLTALTLIPSLPAFSVGNFAKFDYDHILSLYLWLWLLSSMFYQDSSKKKWLYIGGVFAGLVLGSWIGSLLIFVVVAVVCFGLWFINSNLCKKYLTFCYTTFGIATIINSLIILISPSRYGTVLLDFGIIHISAMVIISLGIYVLSKYKPTNKFRIILLVLAIGIPLVFYLINPVNFQDLIEKVFGSDPIYQEIQELQPLIELKPMLHSNIHFIDKALQNYGFFIFLLPLFLFVSVKRFINKDSVSLLKLWVTVVILASFYQNRYTRIFGIGSCIYAAFIFFYCLCLYKEKNRYKNQSLLSKSLYILVILVFISIIRLTSWSYILPNPLSNDGIRTSEMEAYKWIKANTPQTSGYYDDKKPEYGILAYWDFGHQINYFAHRPVIANNMQNGVKNMADIFSSKDEETAFRLCEELGVKYVFMAPDRVLFPSTINYWPAYKNQERGPGYQALPSNVVRSNDYEKWFFYWLNQDFGMKPRGDFGTTTHFRILFANSEKQSPTFSTMLFEVVKGARLILKAQPNSTASISLHMRIGKKFGAYQKEVKVSEDGYVCFILPYSCYFNNGIVSTGELYDFFIVSHETGKRVKGRVSIKEADVIAGNQVATGSVVIFK
ncbi:MAG: hypothetical protein IKO19_13025 [Candidatus Riflebacteria bacterium]|nr:hypothetical protein [Candidatus Riflebacteria bacterium]